MGMAKNVLLLAGLIGRDILPDYAQPSTPSAMELSPFR
jgi:hypothetical protein